jgi:hypothetical protein
MGSRPNGRQWIDGAGWKQLFPTMEVQMSTPPRTEREQAAWEIRGDPSPARRASRPDKLGVGLVAVVLLAVLVAIVVLFLL